MTHRLSIDLTDGTSARWATADRAALTAVLDAIEVERVEAGPFRPIEVGSHPGQVLPDADLVEIHFDGDEAARRWCLLDPEVTDRIADTAEKALGAPDTLRA